LEMPYCEDGYTEQRPRPAAVLDIRQQIFDRSSGKCELCQAPITWNTFHMHERQHRGQFVGGKSGEISLDNSTAICVQCHKDAHSNREPKFSVRKADKEEA
jgi:5-methylcytosine-specific restriction endonuclease McrA